MRFYILLISGILSFSLNAQHLNFSHWQYTDGNTDAGKVRGLHRWTKTDLTIRLYGVRFSVKGKADKLRLPCKSIAFLVEKNDTVLIRKELEGRSRLLQKIHNGPANLYREISSRKDKHFYLELEGVYHPIHYRFTRHLLADDFLPNESEFQIPKKLTNNYQAIEFAHQFNSALVPDAKGSSNRQYFLGRNRVGIGGNLTRLSQDYFDNRLPLFFRSHRHTIRQPNLSVSYERQLHQSFPWLYGQLQCRIFRINESRDWWHRDSRIIHNFWDTNISEQLKVTNFYAYPGLLFEFRQRYKLRPYFGGGIAIVQPLRFYRHITAMDVPGLPNVQVVENLQPYSLGHYQEAGLRHNFRRNVLIGFSLRWEKLQQEARPTAETILESNLFMINPVLAEEKQLVVQLQLQYSW